MKYYLKRAKKWLLEEKYHNKKTSEYFKDIERIKKGEPLDYVIGFRKFLDCHIDLSFKPLIPREETEYWVEKAIREIQRLSNNQKLNILDIFSGSGCIGAALLKHLPKSKVVFAEKYTKFINQIKLNLKLNKINSKKYKIVKSDIFSNIKEKFDFIFANPPYVSIKNVKKVQKSVLLYEPRKAIFAQKDGLYFIKKFLQQAKYHLKQNGVIFLEFDSSQKTFLEKLLKKAGYSNYQFFKDQFNHLRYLKIIK
ncbi:MAG: peptide chain release factor N(5)-glutamine methyltransferase [Minisyncoccia bacterium]